MVSKNTRGCSANFQNFIIKNFSTNPNPVLLHVHFCLSTIIFYTFIILYSIPNIFSELLLISRFFVFCFFLYLRLVSYKSF